MAMPFRWQRSSAARRETNGGRQSGLKLALALVVARQLNRVLTNTGAPSWPIPTSWMSMSPVVYPMRGTKRRSKPSSCSPGGRAFSNRQRVYAVESHSVCGSA